jgi:plastocyanin
VAPACSTASPPTEARASDGRSSAWLRRRAHEPRRCVHHAGRVRRAGQRCRRALERRDEYLTNVAKLKGAFPSHAVAKAGTGPADVAITGVPFGPGTLKVAAGQKVTWTNADDTRHQITPMQFDAAGNIAYVCGLHPTMKGTIEVAAK